MEEGEEEDDHKRRNTDANSSTYPCNKDNSRPSSACDPVYLDLHQRTSPYLIHSRFGGSQSFALSLWLWLSLYTLYKHNHTACVSAATF